MKMRTRVFTALGGLILALGASLSLASPALAAAGGCSTGGAYSSTWQTCFNAHGSGYYLYYVKVTAQTTAQGQPVDFPNFVGCGVHAQLYNNYPDGNYRSWNTPGVSCGDFVASGYSFIVPVYADVPGGQYCTKLWVDTNNSVFVSGSASCFSVQH
jgi:hypothetical protein